jgi:hypothetical protein
MISYDYLVVRLMIAIRVYLRVEQFTAAHVRVSALSLPSLSCEKSIAFSKASSPWSSS